MRIHIFPSNFGNNKRHFSIETSSVGYGYGNKHRGHHYWEDDAKDKLKLEDLPRDNGDGFFPLRPKPGRYVDIEVDDISKVKPSSFKASSPDPDCFDCLTEILRDVHRAGNPRLARKPDIQLSEMIQKGKKSKMTHNKEELIRIGGLNEKK